jgi:hypothetical protein
LFLIPRPVIQISMTPLVSPIHNAEQPLHDYKQDWFIQIPDVLRSSSMPVEENNG